MNDRKIDFADALEEVLNSIERGEPKEEVLLNLLQLNVEVSQLQLTLANLSYAVATSIAGEKKYPLFSLSNRCFKELYT